MQIREFVMKTESLEIDYNDTLAIELIEECLFEGLEVPAECIESLSIKLSNDKRYFNDDWYTNLQRVA
ncbi:MAG: hypothetical protein COA39_002945 [Sulfurimonas sp.]|nr:hypothetical protein [Sulfurimonas sp.]